MQLDKYVIPLKTIYFYYISKVFENDISVVNQSYTIGKCHMTMLNEKNPFRNAEV